MLYVLDNYYATNHYDSCVIVESDKDIKDVVEICGAIEFLFENNFNNNSNNELKMYCLLNILIDYYNMKDKKEDIPNEALKRISMPIFDIYRKTIISNNGIAIYRAYIIDLYEIKDFYFNLNLQEKIMEKWLPSGDALEKLKSELLK